MQPLDKNTLFSIFEQSDEAIYQEHNVQDVLHNPYVLVGMVVNGVQNYNIMDTMYSRHYGNKYKNVQKDVKFKYFNKLYGYLKRIDFNNITEDFKIGESFDRMNALQSLSSVLYYFENLEEYEKCAHIKKFLDLLNDQA